MAVSAMLENLINTFLISISPFGEGRAGLPYAFFNDIHWLLAFAVALSGNLLVYPIMMWLIDVFNHKCWKYTTYRKAVVYLSKMAKKGAGPKIKKHGFWGLMIFVMIPLPGTGAYMGTIAAAIFKINRWQAFLAISIGTFISCALVAAGFYLGSKGVSFF